MNVLIAHARYAQHGGEEAVITAQERALVTRGHKVIRFEVDNDGLTRAGAVSALWSRSAQRKIARVMDRLGDEPHVLHVHNNFQQLSPSIYAPAQRRGIKVVQHLHNARLACINVFFERDGRICTDCVGKAVTWPGVAHSCYRGSKLDSIAATAVQLGHRAVDAYRNVDRFVAVSSALADALQTENTIVCHNGVADPRLVRNDQGYALFVGRVTRQKGMQVLVDAARAVPEVPVRVVGDIVERFDAPDNVTFVGRLDRKALNREFAGARVIVAPSLGFDPLPTTVIEALAAGVPVIGSNAGGIPEIVGDAGVLVPPGDPVALADALRGDYEHLSAVARARYEAEFTIDAFGLRLEQIYQGLSHTHVSEASLFNT